MELSGDVTAVLANGNRIERNSLEGVLKYAITVLYEDLVDFFENFDHSVRCFSGDSFKVCKISSNVSSLLLCADRATHVVEKLFFDALIDERTNVLKRSSGFDLDAEHIFPASTFTVKVAAAKNSVKPIQRGVDKILLRHIIG